MIMKLLEYGALFAVFQFFGWLCAALLATDRTLSERYVKYAGGWCIAIIATAAVLDVLHDVWGLLL